MKYNLKHNDSTFCIDISDNLSKKDIKLFKDSVINNIKNGIESSVRITKDGHKASFKRI